MYAATPEQHKYFVKEYQLHVIWRRVSCGGSHNFTHSPSLLPRNLIYVWFYIDLPKNCPILYTVLHAHMCKAKYRNKPCEKWARATFLVAFFFLYKTQRFSVPYSTMLKKIYEWKTTTRKKNDTHHKQTSRAVTASTQNKKRKTEIKHAKWKVIIIVLLCW